MGLSQLQLRIASAIVMISAVAVVLWLGAFAFKVLVAFLLAAMVAEWLRLLSKKDEWPLNSSFVASLLVVSVTFMVSTSQTIAIMLVLNILAALSVIGLNWRWLEQKWMLIWPLLIAIACNSAWACYLLFGPLTLLWLLVVVWATDIGAYFTGRSLGGPKLMPAVSPNKTWSGAIGGVVVAVIASVLFLNIVSFPAALLSQITLAISVTALISVFSQTGDLLESFAKRRHNLKDSSQLIPGHGGILDRLDGLLPTIPIAYLILSALT